MGRFKHLVDSPAGMEGFRAKYCIPQGVGLEYCPPDQVLTLHDVVHMYECHKLTGAG